MSNVVVVLEHTTPEQLKAITDNLEKQCESAWMIIDHIREPVPESLQLQASGLTNFLADLGVDGYEM